MTFLPLARSSSTLDYFNQISKYSLSDGLTKVVAMDLGKLNNLKNLARFIWNIPILRTIVHWEENNGQTVTINNKKFEFCSDFLKIFMLIIRRQYNCCISLSGLKETLFHSYLISDASYLFLALGLITLSILIFTQSFFLTLTTLISITFSIILAYALYTVVFQVSQRQKNILKSIVIAALIRLNSSHSWTSWVQSSQ